MKKIESFRWWINDYITSTVRRRCSLEARGLYLDILMVLYRSPRPGYACENIGGSLVYLGRDEILADAGSPRAARLFDDLAKWGGVVYDEDCGGWYNPKALDVAESEVDFRRKKIEAGRKGGNAKAKRKQRPSSATIDATSSAKNMPAADFYPPDTDPDPDSEPDPDTEPDNASPRDKNQDTETVVAAWREAWNAPDYRMGWQDQQAILQAMSEGWTVEQLCGSVRGWTHDDWKDRKLHNSIETLMRDSAQIQKGISLGDVAAEPETDRGTPEVSEMEKAGQRPMWDGMKADGEDVSCAPEWWIEEQGGQDG